MLALLLAASVSLVEDPALPVQPLSLAPLAAGHLCILATAAPGEAMLVDRAPDGTVSRGTLPDPTIRVIAPDADGVSLWAASRDAVYRRDPEGEWHAHALRRTSFARDPSKIRGLAPGKVAVLFPSEGVVVATDEEVRSRAIAGVADLEADGAGRLWATVARPQGQASCLASVVVADESWRVSGDPVKDLPDPQPFPSALVPPDHCFPGDRLFAGTEGVLVGDALPMAALRLDGGRLGAAPSAPPSSDGRYVSLASPTGVLARYGTLQLTSHLSPAAPAFEPGLGDLDVVGEGRWMLLRSRADGEQQAAGLIGRLGDDGSLIISGSPPAFARLRRLRDLQERTAREDAETASPYRWGWGIAGALVGLSAGTVTTATLADAGWAGAATQIGLDGLVGAFPIGLTLWAADEWFHTPAGESGTLSLSGMLLGSLATIAVVPAITVASGHFLDPDGRGGYGGAVLGTAAGLLVSYGLHALFETLPVRFQWMFAGMLTGSGATLGYRLSRMH